MTPNGMTRPTGIARHWHFLSARFAMVALTGLVRNMNHIVLGTDDPHWLGFYSSLGAIGVGVALNVLANWVACRQPRTGKRSVTHGPPSRFSTWNAAAARADH